MVSSPKTLDLLLRGQLQDNLNLAGEADLVDWWWDEQVKGANNLQQRKLLLVRYRF